MIEQQSNQTNQTGQGQTAPAEAPASAQASQQQSEPVQAKPERPVFPSNSLLTEASQRMERPADTKSDTGKDE